MPYFPEPKNDAERLMNLQREYRTGSNAALGDMYELMTRVAIRLLSATKEAYNYTPDERHQKAHDAATYVIEQYIKRPDFVRTDKGGITGYLRQRVIHELRPERKCDMMVVYGDTPEPQEHRKHYRYVVKNMTNGSQRTYETIDELRAALPKLRFDKLRRCISCGAQYKQYRIQLLEIEGD